MYREIKVGNSRIAKVSPEDFEFLSQFNWHAHVVRVSAYAATWVHYRPSRRVSMHVMLNLGAGQVDHIDRDTLNNQRANLRPCTSMQNRWNCGPTKRNTSGIRGVWWDSRHLRWYAQIRANERYCLGSYKTLDEAAAVHREASLRLHGEFSPYHEAVKKLRGAA